MKELVEFFKGIFYHGSKVLVVIVLGKGLRWIIEYVWKQPIESIASPEVVITFKVAEWFVICYYLLDTFKAMLEVVNKFYEFLKTIFKK
jgi:hypothetical protein